MVKVFYGLMLLHVWSCLFSVSSLVIIYAFIYSLYLRFKSALKCIKMYHFVDALQWQRSFSHWIWTNVRWERRCWIIFSLKKKKSFGFQIHLKFLAVSLSPFFLGPPIKKRVPANLRISKLFSENENTHSSRLNSVSTERKWAESLREKMYTTIKREGHYKKRDFIVACILKNKFIKYLQFSSFKNPLFQ